MRSVVTDSTRAPGIPATASISALMPAGAGASANSASLTATTVTPRAAAVLPQPASVLPPEPAAVHGASVRRPRRLGGAAWPAAVCLRRLDLNEFTEVLERGVRVGAPISVQSPDAPTPERGPRANAKANSSPSRTSPCSFAEIFARRALTCRFSELARALARNNYRSPVLAMTSYHCRSASARTSGSERMSSRTT